MTKKIEMIHKDYSNLYVIFCLLQFNKCINKILVFVIINN